MKWYWVILISFAWIAVWIVYARVYDTVANKYLEKKEGANQDTLAAIYLSAGFFIGISALYLSWPIMVLLFGLVDVAWYWWALIAINVICFALAVPAMLENGLDSFKAMPKIPALVLSTFICAGMLVFSPLVLIAAYP